MDWDHFCTKIQFTSRGYDIHSPWYNKFMLYIYGRNGIAVVVTLTCAAVACMHCHVISMDHRGHHFYIILHRIFFPERQNVNKKAAHSGWRLIVALFDQSACDGQRRCICVALSCCFRVVGVVVRR